VATKFSLGNSAWHVRRRKIDREREEVVSPAGPKRGSEFRGESLALLRFEEVVEPGIDYRPELKSESAWTKCVGDSKLCVPDKVRREGRRPLLSQLDRDWNELDTDDREALPGDPDRQVTRS
jgi:hypothetical protein